MLRNALLLCFLTLMSAQILLDQRKTTLLRANALLGLRMDHHKARPQRLVPRHNPIQRSLQRWPIQPAPQPHATGYVIRRARALQLRQEPQPLLRKRRRQSLAPLATRDRRQTGPIRLYS